MSNATLLIELLTEELPPKALPALAKPLPPRFMRVLPPAICCWLSKRCAGSQVRAGWRS